MKFLLSLLLSTCVIAACAQSSVITLKPDRILDGMGGVITGQNVLIKDGKIIALSTQEEGLIYELGGMTLMPGGIDTHSHLAWHFDDDGKLHDASEVEESLAVQGLYAAENAFQTLLGGITTSQSIGSPIEGALRDAIDRGILPGPRVITSLGAISARTGDADSIRAAVRRFASEGADVIKIFASASIRVGGTPTLSQEQLDAACSEAAAQGLRAVVHAHGPESARRSVMAGCTAIEHGALLDKQTLQLISERGVYYDPHISLIFNNYFDNKDKYIGIGGYTEDGFKQMELAVPKAVATFKQALQTDGLQIVFGTDAVAGAHGSNFEELIARVQIGGQDPSDALVSANSLAAKSLGLDGEIGSIAVGMSADIIAIEGDPSKDITLLRNVGFVMKNGQVFKNQPSSKKY